MDEESSHLHIYNISSYEMLTKYNICYLKYSEKKKRKQQNETAGLTNSIINDKPETVHIVTVMMSSCILMLFPYDLPEFVPALLTSFVRHGTIPYLKDTVMRTVQEFKRTHQDRWNDFKTSFTQDQLDDIQGAGAAHYFS